MPALVLVHVLEDQFVADLVVPALELVHADDPVPAVLHLFAARGRSDHAQAQQAGVQVVAGAGVVAEAEQEGADVGPVVGDQVGTRVVGGGEQRVAEGEHHVLLFEIATVYPAQVAVEPAGGPGQAGVARVVRQVGRDQGEHQAVAVSLVLAGAAEKIVVRTHVDDGTPAIHAALVASRHSGRREYRQGDQEEGRQQAGRRWHGRDGAGRGRRLAGHAVHRRSGGNRQDRGGRGQ